MELPSRTWSAETLNVGVGLIASDSGMDSLADKSSDELQQELERLEDW